MAYERHIWECGEPITESKLNHMEEGIADAFRDRFDTYDLVIKQVDSNTPTLEKGSYSDIYDALQEMKVVTGVYVQNTTPDGYHNATCYYIQFTAILYYSSANCIIATALFHNGNTKRLLCELHSDNTVTASVTNP